MSVNYKKALSLPGATKIALVLPDNISFYEWQEVGQKIIFCAQSCMWWLGDWWAFGEHKYGERAAQALKSDYAFQTFADAGWVSNKIETSRRHEHLSWSHHREVAALVPDEQDKLLNEAEEKGLSRGKLRKKVRDLKTIKREAELLPTGKYRIIYADPPWKYSDERNLDGYDSNAASNSYPTMSLDEICDLLVKDLAAKDSVLFLWVTAPMLEDAFYVIDAWGYQYKTNFVWDKVKPGMGGLGHYHDTNHEHLLLATRGEYLKVHQKFDSVQEFEKTKTHSKKPDEFRAMIDAMYPEGSRIELFRRGDSPNGWAIWGNEAIAIKNRIRKGVGNLKLQAITSDEHDNFLKKTGPKNTAKR